MLAAGGSRPQRGHRGTSLTLLDDLLGLLPDTSVAQEPPLPLLANLALQVMLFWDLSVYQHIHNTKQQEPSKLHELPL